jgi:RNA polymerase sigma factor (sigma-70 family)
LPHASPGELPGPDAQASALSDEALIERIREGSELHFNQLYERYFQRIYNFVYLRVRNHADAEELTQETFTAVFQSIGGYSGRSSPLGWVYGIAKNTVHNHLRRLRTQGSAWSRGPRRVTATSPAWFPADDQLATQSARRSMPPGSVSEWQAEVFFAAREDLPIRSFEANHAISDAIRRGLPGEAPAGRGRRARVGEGLRG